MFKEKKNIFPEETKAQLTNLKESRVHPLRHLPLLCQVRGGSHWDTGRVQKILSKRIKSYRKSDIPKMPSIIHD